VAAGSIRPWSQAFEKAAEAPGFWETLHADHLHDAIFALAPAQRVEFVDDDYLDDIAVAFAGVIDAKSPYTHGHSQRVAVFTDLIGKELGFTAEKRRWLKRAALLHDIGKLGVSNAILDKPAKLDDEEWGEMRSHTLYGEAILSRIGAFSSVAEIAGARHERLDDKGYPRGRRANSLSWMSASSPSPTSSTR
jgi:HD-GYP domain-containing protein (c-di-GMP phosphodiesterase class II)